MNQKRINTHTIILTLVLIVCAFVVASQTIFSPNNNDAGSVKIRKTLSIRIDRELVNAKYFTITGTDLVIKIPVSYTIPQSPDQIQTQTPYTQNIVAVTDNESDLARNIRECDYDYNRVPSVQKKSFDETFCKSLMSNYSQQQLDTYQNLRIQHNFFIQTINTNLTPQEWVLDNVSYQGIKLRDEPNQISRGNYHTINGISYLGISVACCGGYEINYITQSSDIRGNKILIKFGTNDFDGRIADNDNIVLDQILATLKKQ